MLVELLFSWLICIYWEDIDVGGVVYYVCYVVFMEWVWIEWMCVFGYGQECMCVEYGMVFVVCLMQMDFIKLVWLDDILQVSVCLVQLKKVSMVFDQQILCDGELLLLVWVCIVVLEVVSFCLCGMDEVVFVML